MNYHWVCKLVSTLFLVDMYHGIKYLKKSAKGNLLHLYFLQDLNTTQCSSQETS